MATWLQSLMSPKRPAGANDALASMRREVDQVFEKAGIPGAAPFGDQPKLDLRQVPGGLVVQVELAGLGEDEVEVWLEDDALLIAGERRLAGEIEESDWRLRERASGAFARRVRLPFTPSPGGVEAEMRHGLLTVMIAKPPKPETKTHRVAVRAAAPNVPPPPEPVATAPSVPAASNDGGMIGQGGEDAGREPGPFPGTERAGGMIGEG